MVPASRVDAPMTHEIIDASEMSFDTVIARLLINAKSPHVVVTPLVWVPSDGTSAKRIYFCIATGPDFKVDAVNCDSDDPAALMDAVILAIAATDPPKIVHITCTELQAASLCATLWPGKKTAEMLKTVESEKPQTNEWSH